VESEVVKLFDLDKLWPQVALFKICCHWSVLDCSTSNCILSTPMSASYFVDFSA
jgi:hypothetical protein